MKLLDWYLALLARQTAGVDVQTSLIYGLAAFAAAMVVLSVLALVNKKTS